MARVKVIGVAEFHCKCPECGHEFVAEFEVEGEEDYEDYVV